MFFGTTPSVISQFIFNEIKTHNPKRVIVPFAGNFVIEQIAGLVSKDIEVLSTDVSVYSRAIGYGLSNTESEIKIKKEMLDIFPILKKKNKPIEKAASIIFLTEATKNINRKDRRKYAYIDGAKWNEKQNIKYYETLHRDAVSNQEMYYKRILQNLYNFKEKLPNKFKFYGTDACLLIDNELQKNDLIFYDPPVMLGDYEKMFKKLEEQLTYTAPEYTEMNDELQENQLDNLKKKHIVYYRRNDKGNTPNGYTEVLRYRYRNRAYYTVYTNKPQNRFVGSYISVREKPKNYKIINREDIITPKSKIKFLEVTTLTANHYRLMWVKKAEMTRVGYCYLIFCDKKLIGIVTLESGVKFSVSYISIFSDPPAPTSRYKRLSKLILYLICTKEFLKEFNDNSVWEHIGFTTKVSTNAPVSMKYRGKFKLHTREEDLESNYKYKLVYQNKDKLCQTFKQALGEWCSKYSKETYNERD